MPQQGWKYVIWNNGVDTYENYPYEAQVLFNKKEFTILINLVDFMIQRNSQCKYNKNNLADVKVTEPIKLPKKRDDYLEKAIYNYGPIAV